MTLLSTGQEYNPRAKELLSSKLSPSAILESAKSGVSDTLQMLKVNTADKVAGGLDAFLGSWAGDRVRNYAIGESNLGMGDYLKMFGAEVRSLLGKEQPKETKAEKKQTVVQEKVASALPEITITKEDDLEHLIKEMKRTSEDELLRYIESNSITNESVVSDLIEAVNAANNEVEKGLRAQFNQSKKDGKSFIRISEDVAEIKETLVRTTQEEYRKDAIELKEPEKDKPEEGQGKEDSSSGIMKMIRGIGSSLLPVVAALAPLVALLGGTRFAKDASLIGEDGKLSSTGETINSISKAVGGNSIAPDATKSDVQLMEEQTKESWWDVFGSKKKAKIAEIQAKVERGVEFSQGEADVIKKNLGIDVPVSSVAPVPQSETTTTQQAIKNDVVEKTEQVSQKKESQAPAVIPVPVVAPSNNKPTQQEVLNIVPVNTESTFRRLSEKGNALAFI